MARPRSRTVRVEPEVFDPEELRRLRAELEYRLDRIRAFVEAKRGRVDPYASPPQSPE